MNPGKRLLLCFILVFTEVVVSTATVRINPSFSRFGSNEGFPQLAINGICQDRTDNIWISSEDGTLFCYNGYDVVWRGKYPQIDRFFCSSSLKLYYTCKGDVYTISDVAGGPAPFKVSFKVKRIGELSGGRIVFCDDEKLFLYDEFGHELFQTAFPSWLTGVNSIKGIGDKLIIGYDDGWLCMWDSQKNVFETLVYFGATISQILPQAGGKCWIATLGSGLFLYDPQTGRSIKYSKENGLSSDYLYDLSMDRNGLLWVGTRLGANIIDTSDNSVAIYRNQINNPSSLSYDTVRRLFLDNQGGMWLGTYFGGVNYWHPSRNRFRTILSGTGNNNINDIVVGGIAQSSDGRMWIGTNKNGVSCYDPASGSMSRYYFLDERGEKISDVNDIKSLWVHPDGRHIYLGTHGLGLAVLDRETGAISMLDSPKFVYSITSGCDANHLVLGTNDSMESLYMYDMENKTSKLIFEGITQILLKDSQGIYWTNPVFKPVLIGDDGTVSEADCGFPDGLTARCAFESSSGEIWFGGDDGLYFYDRKTAPKHIDTGSQIPAINSMCMDLEGMLWLGTENGLFEYDPISGRTQRYGIINGIASNFLNWNSLCKTVDGEMWFGGLGGISIVLPHSSEDDLLCPVPLPGLSQMFVNEQKRENNTRQIVLHHDENRVSFTLSVPDYCAVQKNIFSYKLDGYDKNWFDAGAERIVTYPSLPKGKYRFMVRASRNGVDWTVNENCIQLKILPVWYKSMVAKLIWIILFSLAIVLTVRWILYQKELKNKIKLHEMEEKHASEIIKIKALKFINSGNASANRIVTDISQKDMLFISSAMKVVEDNMSNAEFNTDTFASAMKMSRMTLHTRISRLTGASSLTFIHKIRFSEACRLLTESDDTIAEIAYKVGFKSPANFTTSFKKYMGETPQEYARHHSGGF